MNQALLQYSYLQVMDLLTTMAFLVHGVQEGNPLVRAMINFSPNPLVGLILVKILALGLGLYCWKGGKMRMLTRINWAFALLVAWNVGTIILSSPTFQHA